MNKPDALPTMYPEIRALEEGLGTMDRVDIADWPEKVCAIWPILRRALKIAKVFVGPEADAVIDEVIRVGDEFCA